MSEPLRNVASTDGFAQYLKFVHECGCRGGVTCLWSPLPGDTGERAASEWRRKQAGMPHCRIYYYDASAEPSARCKACTFGGYVSQVEKDPRGVLCRCKGSADKLLQAGSVQTALTTLQFTKSGCRRDSRAVAHIAGECCSAFFKLNGLNKPDTVVKKGKVVPSTDTLGHWMDRVPVNVPLGYCYRCAGLPDEEAMFPVKSADDPRTARNCRKAVQGRKGAAGHNSEDEPAAQQRRTSGSA